jgi:hypothetical protein
MLKAYWPAPFSPELPDKNEVNGAGEEAQVVEHLPSKCKCKVLSSNPSTATKKKKKKRMK